MTPLVVRRPGHGLPRPLPTRRPKPNEPLREDDRVTICIGAICNTENNPQIIFCCDTKLSIPGFTSFHAGFKFGFLSPAAPVLIADDMARGKDLITTFGLYLNATEITAVNLAREFKKPPLIQKAKLIDGYFQLKWAVTYQDYLAGALRNLPAQVLDEIARDVANIRLGCQLIIGLFVRDKPMLFTVNDEGDTQPSDHFAVIGSGSWLAQAALCHRNYNQLAVSFEQALYYVYEAKRLSQSESNVGPLTLMAVLNRTGFRFVTQEGIDALETWFERYGPQQLNQPLVFPTNSLSEPVVFRAPLREQNLPLLSQDATKDDSRPSSSRRPKKAQK